MSDHQAKQAAYAAKRKHATRLEQVPMLDFRVVLPDGTERHERAIGLSQIAAYWPDAIRVERMDAAGFW